MLELPEEYKKYKYTSLFQKNETTIGDDNRILDGYYLAVSNNKKRLKDTIEEVCWNCFLRGFIWTTSDFSEELDPIWLLYRKCDEKKNKMLNTLELIPYEKVSWYSFGSPETIATFRQECEDAHAEHGLYWRKY